MELNKIALLLSNIIKRDRNREDDIKRFQNLVWETEEPLSDDVELSEKLEELAYDLDYYEHNEDVRSEDASLYDQKRLDDEVLDVLNMVIKKGETK